MLGCARQQKMKVYSIILALIVGLTTYSQIPRDTSFTLRATFEKEKKKFPFIEIAEVKPAANTTIKRDIVYRKLGDRSLLLDIYYPNSKTNNPTSKARLSRPAVLLIFGGGWRSGDRSQNEAMATELANHGYVAISAEYRLSPELIFPGALYDLKAAIRWMRANANTYHIDTNHIAVLGCSAGGQLAALIGTTNKTSSMEDAIGNSDHSSAVQAIIDIDGILAFKHPESAEGQVASLWLGGTFEQRPDNWIAASPLTHVSISTPPTLFLNSSQPRFHAGRTDMIRKMDSLHIYSEVHEFPDTPHPFWFFHPWFDPMMKYALSFLGKVFN